MAGSTGRDQTLEERQRSALLEAGQDHLLAAAERDGASGLIERLNEIDWSELEIEAEEPDFSALAESRVLSLEERSAQGARLREAGEAAYRRGEAAVLMVAGGQGTRLGYPGPKGCFTIGPVSDKSVYQLQVEKVLAASRISGKAIPFLVMTSPATDGETKEFFREHGNFGLPDEQLVFFRQGTVPSIDLKGRALLAGPSELLENPDGHGGCFTALVRQGLLDRLKRQGIKHLVYIQVDNVLAPVYDPELLGLAVLEDADVITKVVEKTDPAEKVGLLVSVSGKDRIVEYIDLTPEQASERAEDGRLRYRWGNTAMHCWSIDYLSRKASEGYRLPFHRSKKPLTAWQDGKSGSVDGFKLERFIFDLLPEARASIGLEVAREREFAPLKNAEGADSPQTVHQLLFGLFRSWLEAAGVQVAPDARVEISPLLATSEEEFLARWDGRVSSVEGTLYLE